MLLIKYVAADLLTSLVTFKDVSFAVHAVCFGSTALKGHLYNLIAAAERTLVPLVLIKKRALLMKQRVFLKRTDLNVPQSDHHSLVSLLPLVMLT